MGKLLPDAANGDHGVSPREPVGSFSVGTFVESLSPSVRGVEAVIRELAQSDVPVLLLAEAGAGKHATAQRIHEMSRRSTQPFRWLHCATLKPEDLSVAQGDGEGQLGSGSIFLEELAELSPDCQTYLQNASAHAKGREDSGNGFARFICGSARDLEIEVKAGRLREDLYYRMSGVCLRLLPLRQRKEDIPLLMGHFLRKYAQEFRREVPDLSEETQRMFQDYSWPGNLRELEDAARVLVALGDEHLAMGGLRALLHRPAGENGGGISLKTASRAASHEAEKELILNVLTRTRWNRRRAAQELRISYKALLYKLKQIGYEGYGAS